MDAQTNKQYSSSEVDLIELVKILGKRWKLLTVVLVLHLIFGLAYSYWHHQPHQYSRLFTSATYYSVKASQSGQYRTFISQDTLKQKIKNVYLPEIIYQLKQKQNVHVNPRDFQFKLMDDYQFKLTAIVLPRYRQQLKLVYDQLYQKLKNLEQQYITQKKQLLANHTSQISKQRRILNQVYTRLWDSLKKQDQNSLKQVENDQSQNEELNLLLSSLAKQSNSGPLIDALKQKQKLESQYVNLALTRNNINQGSISQLRDYGAVGLSTKQILAITLFAGLVLGLILVYFVEYIIVVHQARLQSQHEKH